MHDTYWEKRLVDGSAELGSDRMIYDKVASWTRGRQDIISASLFFQNQIIRIVCLPNDGRLASWKQLDGHTFIQSTGESRRISRELWCSPNGYQTLSLIKNPRGGAVFTFGNDFRHSVPNGTSFLVCSIGIDGKVSYRWN